MAEEGKDAPDVSQITEKLVSANNAEETADKADKIDKTDKTDKSEKLDQSIKQDGGKSETEKLDAEFNEYLQRFESLLVTYNFREKSLATEWLTKLKKTSDSIDEKKLRNRFIKHFIDASEEPGCLGGAFTRAPFKTLPKNFKDGLKKLKNMLPKSPDEALNPTEEEKLTYISDLFANLPDKGKFLASQPVPRDGSFFILVSVNTR